MSRQLDNQAVLLALETGHYYSLNETGSQVWRRLGEGASLGEIEHDLKVAFETSPTVWDDLVECIQELVSEGLVEIVPA